MPIRIETGRFTNIRDPITGKLKKIKSTERICQLCTKNEIENEIHFLCVCPIYGHLRFLLYSKVVESVLTMTAEHKFILLVTKYQKKCLTCLITLDMSHLSENQDEVIDIKDLMLLCMHLKSEVAHIKRENQTLRTRVGELEDQLFGEKAFDCSSEIHTQAPKSVKATNTIERSPSKQIESQQVKCDIIQRDITMKDVECSSANNTATQTCEVTNLKQTGFRHTNDDRNKIVKGVFRIKSASSTMLQHANHLV